MVRIKENIEQHAKRDVDRLNKLFIKNAKHEVNAKENKVFAIEEAKIRRDKYDIRR